MANLTARLRALAEHPHLLPKFARWWMQSTAGREPSFTADGLTFRGFPNFSAYAGAWRHMMREDERAFFRHHVNGDAILFDVGANFGTYASLFARMAPQATVFAFEPHPRTAAMCRRNILSNELAQIELIDMAVGREIGTIGFTSHGIPGTERIAVGEDAKLTVPVTTLDEFCSQRVIKAIDFIKIDVEGAELDVLEGGRSLFERCAVRLGLIEVCPANLEAFGRSVDDMIDWLAEVGYELRTLNVDSEDGVGSLFPRGIDDRAFVTNAVFMAADCHAAERVR